MGSSNSSVSKRRSGGSSMRSMSLVLSLTPSPSQLQTPQLTTTTRREQLYEAITRRDVKRVKTLVSGGKRGSSAGLDVKNDLRALELATYSGSNEIVAYLLCHGCRPSSKLSARALDLAVWLGHDEIARQMLRAGFEYRGKNCFDETILFVAACANNASLTETLIERGGCDLDEVTRANWTALHAAAARDHHRTLAVLAKHGCNLDIQDRDGLTALHYSIRNENISSMRLLTICGCRIDMQSIECNQELRTKFIKSPQLKKHLINELTRVKSLKELSRLQIRRSLGQRVIAKTQTLPLAQALKDYVCMSDIFAPVTSSSSATTSSSSFSIARRSTTSISWSIAKSSIIRSLRPMRD